MSTDIANRVIWLDGELVNVNEAKINVLTPTAQFGLNVFEGIRCYWNDEDKELYIFRLEEHYKRLQRSIRLLEMDCQYSLGEMEQALIQVIRANEYREDIAVRQTVFVKGFGSWGAEGPTGMFISPIPKAKSSAEYNKTGLHCCISSWRRIADNVISPRIKCGANYINSRMAQREALRHGYDTAIFLNEAGKVAEGPGSCLFFVKNGRLITPSLTDSVLESITRATVMELAGEMGILVEERSVDRTELYAAEEAFLCGSAMEITPILSVDGYALASVREGGMTGKIHQLYLKAVMGRLSAHRNWVNPVYK